MPVPGAQLSPHSALCPHLPTCTRTVCPRMLSLGDNANGHDAKTMSIYNMGLMSLRSWREIISLVYSQPHLPSSSTSLSTPKKLYSQTLKESITLYFTPIPVFLSL